MKNKVVWLVGLSVVLLTQIPYGIAALNSTHGAVFGGFLLNPVDGNSYLAKMYEGWAGSWQFYLPYTANPGQGSYLFLFYIFLGHLARWSSLPLLVVFHLARAVFSFLMVCSLGYFWQKIFDHPAQQRDAFLFSCFCAGMGWLAYPLFSRFTPDFWVAEAYPFLSAYANPHFPLAIAIILWIIVQALKPVDIRTLAMVGTASLGLGLLLPFGVVIVGGVVAVFEIWNRKTNQNFNWKLLGMIALGGGIPLVYELILIRTHPVLAAWNAQNVTPAPAPLDYAIAFLPVIILACLSIRRITSHPKPGSVILLAWLVIGVLLTYLPIALQRRFMLGWMIPVSGIAAIGLAVIQEQRARTARLVRGVVFTISVLTPLVVILSSIPAIQKQDPAVYLIPGEQKALAWLASHTDPGSIIVAAPKTSLLIPAYTGRKVVFGHPFETIQAASAKNWVEGIYQKNQSEAVLASLSDSQHIDYLVFGPREAEIGVLPNLPGIQKVYDAIGIQIYRVNP